MSDSGSPRPLILVFVADLLFSPRIIGAANRHGFETKIIDHADQIGDPDPGSPDRQYGEHLEGRTAVLIEKITRWRPSLIIFDLNNEDIPWQRWISVLKSAPATRRIPVVTFGQHTDVVMLTSARDAGADAVLARSAFVVDLPALIKKYARVPDYAAIANACQQPLSELAVEGIRLFNLGDYFEAHEVLEHAWNADESEAKDLYRAILQVAVAYLQIERQNYRGAVKMFLRLRQWLAPLPETCRGLDIAALRQAADRAERALLSLGEARIGEFERRFFEPIRYVG